MIRIGLTGGIGSGKSRVLALLAELGAAVISADQVAREVVEPGKPAYRHVVERFGPDIVRADGSLDRAKLAAIVFHDADARRDLEAIVHPAVREETEAKIAALAARRDGPRVVVNEVPLLFEAGREGDFDQIWVVYASEETALRRAAARDNASEAQIRARMAAQMPIAEKVKRADVVIDNDGDWEATERQVRAIWRELCAAYGLNEDGKAPGAARDAGEPS